MDFNPIFIEDVLTISKKGLENCQRNGYYNAGTLTKIIEENDNFSFNTEIEYCKKTNNLKMDLHFQFLPTKYNFCANVTFSVQSANHSVKYQRTHREFVEAKEFKFQKWSADLCSIADVLNPEKNFLVDGNLVIHIRAMIYNKPSESEEKSCTNLGKFLWNRNDDRDFVIVVGAKDGPKTEVKIHKLIFASRSPVFDRMLETEMTEKAQNRLEIIDFNVEVVQAAVEYFYDRDTFKFLNADNLFDLLFFADKYDIADLKAKIEPLFLSEIYPDTIVKIANVSVITNSSTLKEICIKSLNLYLYQNVLFDDAETLDEEIEKELVYDLVRRVFYDLY